MPVLPSSLIEPVWVPFAALLPDRPTSIPSVRWAVTAGVSPTAWSSSTSSTPWCMGSVYERIATEKCMDRTIRRRLAEWAKPGIAAKLHAVCLAAFDRMIGLQLGEIAVDGYITKAPCGGEKAGPSPVDRRKAGLKRAAATEGTGVPLGIVTAGANRHDSPLLEPTLAQTRQQVADLPAGGLPAHTPACISTAVMTQAKRGTCSANKA